MSNVTRLRGFLVLALSTMLLASPALAQKAKVGTDALDQLVVNKPSVFVASDTMDFELVRGNAPQALSNAFDAFRSTEGGTWTMLYDNVTGQPGLIEGGGVPWIPGAGNTLRLVDQQNALVAVEAAPSIPRSVMVDKAMHLVTSYPALFGVDPRDLKVIDGATGPMLDYLYFVDFQWTYQGLPVEHAHVVFRVNHGNLIQFGEEYVSSSISKLDANPYITMETAWDMVHGYASWTGNEEIVDSGRLVVMPMAGPGGTLSYGLVYVMAFRRPGVMGTWQVRVDAHSGEIVQFKDTNDYGHVQGGAYVTDKTPTQTEVSKAMPYADYGTSLYSDASGNFTGTSGTSALNGKYVKIVDSCGAASKASDANGLIDFLASSGTDCTTPGSGGAGNTHASRTQYWNVTQIKLKALTYLPSNTWLAGKLTDNVDLNQTCNAYWNGTSLNFFKSGGGCANTGELPGVSLHEWGHGLDQNDGAGSMPDSGSGESYADTTALLQTHNSCMGGGFLGSNCGGYGNPCTNCTGVREVDYAKHQSATPATPLAFNKTNCPAASCTGPCGKECHCESAPPSQAVWDLANRDLVTWGMDVTSAWQLVDKLWYASRSTATGEFACGNNNSCNVGNLFAVFRAVDDCDGNLANGTPHASAIWNAFNRHQIGCSTAISTDSSCGCASLGTPSLSGTAGNGSNSVSWGAVTGAASYNVYRNEVSCTAGYTKVANTTGTSFTDTVVANGTAYYYRAQAIGSGSCPPSLMSNCVTLTPTAGSNPDFTVSVSPTAVSAVQGGSAQATVSTAVSGGFNAAIALTASGLPAGASASFNPTSIPAPGSGSSTLTLSAGTAAVGTYSVTITATGGGKTHTTAISFTITSAPVPDFTLGMSPTSVTATQGTNAQSTASTSVSGGFNAAIALSVSGVPSGASASFSPASIPAPGSGSSTLTISTGTAAAGAYSLTITGTGGGKTHTAALTLNVTAPGGSYPQSAHPYTNSLNQTWSYTQTGSPTSINVTFDAQTQVESGYDYLYVKDKNGTNISGSPFTGAGLSGKTVNVPGDTVKVTLTSDSSVTAYGFKITNVTAGGGGGSQQLLLNPGFESGAVSWTQSTGVIDNSASEAAHTGSWKAWENGYGSAHTDTIYQAATIPSTATSATLTFWLHIDTAETGTTAYDTLKVQIRNSSGTVLATLATYSNANAAAGYSQKSFNVVAYKGQTIQVYLVGTEDASLQTSFVTDDFALTVQ